MKNRTKNIKYILWIIYSFAILFLPIFVMKIVSHGNVFIDEVAYFSAFDIILNGSEIVKTYGDVTFNFSTSYSFIPLFIIFGLLSIIFTNKKRHFSYSVVSFVLLILTYLFIDHSTMVRSEITLSQGFVVGSYCSLFILLQILIYIAFITYFYKTNKDLNS